MFLPYFIMGEAAANLMECSHWLRKASSDFSSASSSWFSSHIDRFAPDLLFLTIGLLMSPLDALRGFNCYLFFRFVGVPLLFTVFLIMSISQRNGQRRNFSRFVCESAFLKLIGYCSFPVYLLQPVAFDYYAKLGGMEGHFSRQPEGYKMMGIGVLFFVSYLIQYYFQNQFVAKIYTEVSAFVGNWRGKCSSKSPYFTKRIS